jgi:KUP system potassium uptake protein
VPLDVKTTSTRSPAGAALTIGALGVVFGDIGTSPIYTIQTVFNPDDPHPVDAVVDNIYGIVSLIFWSVTIIVTIKYVLLVLRADNEGEGGILSLITQITRQSVGGSARLKVVLAGLGIFGASLFFGDGMITPAVSVLSAVEGIELVEPSFARFVVPVTAVIIVVLFATQKYGTAKVGRLFGPVMILWFTAIGACGIGGIVREPRVLEALSPTYALSFFFGNIGEAFFALAAVVLAVTGAEALFADLGHFGRGPITRAWLVLVFPACTLSYLGQGALIIHDPERAIASPFFLLVPDGLLVPMVLLATAATVIASQAVITGAFSVAQQAVRLGYLPRLRIINTSAEQQGQIYVPWINWVLMVVVLVLVFAFESSAALAYAYGMNVCGTIMITTLLFFYVARRRWGVPRPLVVAGAVFFLSVEVMFLAANVTKIPYGAWLPLLIAVIVFTVLTTWQRGRQLVTAQREHDEGDLRAFVAELHEQRPPLTRVPGTAVFLNRGKTTAPLAMRANVEHNQILHEHVVILSLETQTIPHVAPADRIEVDELGFTDDGIVHVLARYGYMETPDVPDLLRRARKASRELSRKPEDTSYFLSTIELRVGDGPGLPRWRKHLFVATSGITADAADFFNLPRDRTVVMGSQIVV